MSRSRNQKSRDAYKVLSWMGRHHSWFSHVVLDEAHTILTEAKFREIMDSARTVMTFKVATVLQTATGPTKLLKALCEKVALPDHTLIRAPTNRTEHQYSVFCVGKGRDTLVEKTAAFVAKATTLLTGTQRGIIFTTAIDPGEDLQELIPGLEFINSRVTDETRRAEIMENWVQGKTGGWLLGTSSLIQGVDYHDVHLVVFMGIPWGMVSFVQGAGRSGRNGNMSRVIVLHTGWHPKVQSPDHQCQTELNTWVATPTRCRRIGISDCMDDEAVTCGSLEGATPCDVCEPDIRLADMVFRSPMPQVVEPPPLAPPKPISSGAESPTQLEVPPFQPRNAPRKVLANGNREIQLHKDRSNMAQACFTSLVTFGTKRCIVCFVREGKLVPRHFMCLNKDRNQEMMAAYDWTRPVRRGQSVRGRQIRLVVH